jgi:uncharacterized protein (TIGR00297 family)
LLNYYLLILIVSIGFCLFAWHKKWLSIPGAFAACILAIIILLSGGWMFAFPMLIFFITSSLLSKLPSHAAVGEIRNKKPRDHIQVICNGGTSGIVSILYLINKNPVFIILYFISISISTSDTWSSETGNYFKGKVLDILSFKKIEKGLSGGVSFYGTFIGFLGSLLIGSLYYFLYEKNMKITFIITIAGFTGMIADSITGSLLQAKYMDKKGHITEMNLPGNTIVKGYQWMTNDMVNLLSNAVITSLACCFF